LIFTRSAPVAAGETGDWEPPRSPRSPGPDPDEPEPGWTAVYLVLGLATPVGEIGLEAATHIDERVEVSAGVGIGSGGGQWALMPRLRWGDDSFAVTAGLGASVGKFAQLQLCETLAECELPGSYALWGNAEVGLEHWSGRLALRGALGLGIGCYLANCVPDRQLVLPYLGFGVGFVL
jgi:hypothetical protein